MKFKKAVFLMVFTFYLGSVSIAQNQKKSIKMNESEYNPLTKEEERVIVNKGTEYPYTGKYNKHFEKGVYHCKACDSPLYNSNSKFESNCGWPSFDDEIKDAVTRHPDYKLGYKRIEICCAKCGGHLGHVFEGEKFTEKNVRHCVNSLSLIFKPNKK